ncbi:helix-turn-helix domain-containing protein [Rhodococcus sp. T7]|uniref:helix-turn-helix domain-containing protein n=1 Tax=Rhodococcus sp. T7 TaxID=627444 RepID=UPI00135CB430|nr:helix-turn-helix domain-containing protein [Rhodococcus sp. T7]
MSYHQIELTPVSGYLSFTEREEIALLRPQGVSMREMATGSEGITTPRRTITPKST